jgi:outer membrane protein assembly factor BamB
MSVPPVWCRRLMLVCLLFYFPPARAIEWLSYRGPNHDGSTPEAVRLDWNEKPLRILWATNLSPALSSFSISQGRLFTQGRRIFLNEPTEFCIALDAKTGKELWNAPVGQAFYPNGGVGDDDGPRSTPTIDGERLFVLSTYLGLYCFDAATGNVHWNRDLLADFGGSVIAWQNAASPLVVDGLVLVNANAAGGNRIYAFNKTNGAVVWKGHNEAMTQSSPVLGTIGGTRQAIFFTQSGLLAVEPLTGQLLWRFGLIYNGTSIAASPVVAGDTVYASRAYPGSLSRPQAGALMLKIAGNGTNFTASQFWMRTNGLMNHWATPVIYSGHIYGMFGQGESEIRLKCVNADDGSEKWSGPGLKYGGVILAKDHIIAVGQDGELLLVDPNPDVYTEVARVQALQSGKCWNTPIVSDGILYMRSTLSAVAFDISVATSTIIPWKLQLSRTTGGQFQLVFEKQDGSAADASVTNRVNVYSTTYLVDPPTNWVKLADIPLFFDGKLRLDNLTEDGTQRFYRMEEVP